MFQNCLNGTCLKAKLRPLKEQKKNVQSTVCLFGMAQLRTIFLLAKIFQNFLLKKSEYIEYFYIPTRNNESKTSLAIMMCYALSITHIVAYIDLPSSVHNK